MFMPKKRKREPMGLRETPQVRSPSHLQFIRAFTCCAFGRGDHECEGKVEAAHIRNGTDGGMGVKPSDSFTVPACQGLHHAMHNDGETSTAVRYGVNFLAVAANLWRVSPAGIKWRKEHEE